MSACFRQRVIPFFLERMLLNARLAAPSARQRDTANRCARKTQSAINAGLIDPGSLRFNMRYMSRVKDFVDAETRQPDVDMERKLHGILRDQPLYTSPDYRRVLRVILRRGELGRIIGFR